MDDCLFCKIAKGEISSTKVYEDANVYAFLDIAPVNPGHSLVIAKKHEPNLYEMSDETLLEVMKVVRNLARAIKEAVGADGINLEMNNDRPAGQMVFHAHMHIIPRKENDGLRHWPGEQYVGSEAEDVAEKIKKALG